MTSFTLDEHKMAGIAFLASMILGSPLQPFGWKSMILGALDDIIARLSSLKVISFEEGGDADVFNTYCDEMRNRFAARDMIAHDVHMDEQWHVLDSIQYCKASFLSPIFEHLPQHEKVTKVHIEIVCPKGYDLDRVIAEGKLFLKLS